MTCTFSNELILETIAFHGHSCPGLTIGIRAAELALREIGDPEETNMVTIAETDMCGVDAIQYITGCTYGKGNFLHRDFGKMAFSFYNGKTGKGIRVLLKPEVRSNDYSEMGTLMKKQSDNSATQEDSQRLKELRNELQDQLMSLDLDSIFTITPLDTGLPRPARILDSLECEHCGESVMESRTRRLERKTLCIPCFNSMDQKTSH